MYGTEIMWIILTSLCISATCSSGSDVMDTKMEKMEGILTKLLSQIEQQNIKISYLEEITRSQTVEITYLKEEISEMKRIQLECGKQVSVEKKHSTVRDKEYDNLSKNSEKSVGHTGQANISVDNEGEYWKRLLIHELPDPDQSMVAFYAYMNHSEQSLNAHHVLVFDVVKTNLYSSYNGFTGVFTAPFGGVYVFTYTIRIICHSAISVEIVKNSNPEGSVFIDSENPNLCDDDDVTGTIVTVANQGDSVFIRTHSTYIPTGSVQSNEYGRTMFAGWLIKNTNVGK